MPVLVVRVTPSKMLYAIAVLLNLFIIGIGVIYNDISLILIGAGCAMLCSLGLIKNE